MKKLLLALILVFSAVVHSETPIEIDEQTGKYLDNLGAKQHGQDSVNYRFEQHGSQYSKDSMNRRNNPMSQYSKDSINKRNNPSWDAVVVDLRDSSEQRLYLRESKNNTNAPSDSSRYTQVHNPDEEPDHGPILRVPIKEW